MDEEKKEEIIEVDKVENVENEEVSNETKQEETKKDRKGFCITALVLGIIALVCFCLWYISIPCGILAIIFGILGIKSESKGLAIAGLITGSIGLIVSTLIIILIFVIGVALGITGTIDGMDYNDFDTHYELDKGFDIYD